MAMDAFSVSVANGLREPAMGKNKVLAIAGVFGGFQGAMPLLGWLCVRTVVSFFKAFEKWTPVVGFVLLLFIGVKMIVEAVKNKETGEEEKTGTGMGLLLVQGIATSIDALSVGFTIESYEFLPALVCSLIIASVTFGLCVLGVAAGKRFGMRFSKASQIAGGVILIVIGAEILIKGLFF